MDNIEIIQLNNKNFEEEGCYCLRSKPNSEGYINKNNWLTDQINDGLKYIKIMGNGKQAGFIEYAPIENSSRVVYGENYLVIHCLWVNITGKGYASQLIQKCIEDAKEQQKFGVIVITNPDTSWTPSKDVFIKNQFVEVEKGPYHFELLVYKFGKTPDPHFPNDWEERLKPFTELTIIRTKQCPFLSIATDNVVDGANKLGIHANIIDIESREQLLRLSPTPYGVYGVIYKNKCIAYHRLTVHSAMKRLKVLL